MFSDFAVLDTNHVIEGCGLSAEAALADRELDRCYLEGRAGDAANIILSAVGHNFRRILGLVQGSLVRDPDRPSSLLPATDHRLNRVNSGRRLTKPQNQRSVLRS